MTAVLCYFHIICSLDMKIIIFKKELLLRVLLYLCPNLNLCLKSEPDRTLLSLQNCFVSAVKYCRAVVVVLDLILI